MQRYLISGILLFLPFLLHALDRPDSTMISIVPKPVMLKTGDGKFVINRSTLILVKGNDQEATRVAQFFADRIRYSGGPLLQVREMTKSDKNLPAIIFSRQKKSSSMHGEGYELLYNLFLTG
jgi:hypothetical protein